MNPFLWPFQAAPADRQSLLGSRPAPMSPAPTGLLSPPQADPRWWIEKRADAFHEANMPTTVASIQNDPMKMLDVNALGAAALTGGGLPEMLLGLPLDVPSAAVRALEGRTRWLEDPLIAAGLIPAKAVTEPLKQGAKAAKRLSPAGMFGKDALTADPSGRIKQIYPQVWEDPATVAAKAEANVADESPWLSLLFGTSRGELADIADQRALDTPGIWTPTTAGNSKTANAIMTPQNEERLVNQLLAFQSDAPNMTRGMKGWYITDPMYNDLVERYGPEVGGMMFMRANSTGYMSPASPVDLEINRGTGAMAMEKAGLLPEFMKKGGKSEDLERIGYPHLMGHPYHSTAQAPNLQRWLNNPSHDPASYFSAMGAKTPDPKVPLYMQSSLVPQLGQQTRLPVGDAHFSRAIGLPWVRNWGFDKKKNQYNIPGKHMKSAEYTRIGPWFYEKVARPAGMEGVPGQATLWGGYGHATGVDTKVGAPKLEIWADNVARRFEELHGRKPNPGSKDDVRDMKKLLDKVLKNDEHAALSNGAPISLLS